ncbi:MAG TPA: DUF3857 domain-containing protein [Saprospiraceae bacterium]|nr:DUF3857 domain-containing protein [Saprospiraceae bacterium]HMQ84885.1 DUF3857 domain-containing protein [Saprospiraceae bacterium]
MKKFILTGLFAFVFFSLHAGIMDDVWQALEQQDRKKARTLLETAIKNDATRLEATMALILLNDIEGQANDFGMMAPLISSSKNISPYLYAIWFSDAFVDGYGKKEKDHLKFLKGIQANQSLHPSIHAALDYQLGVHYLMDYDKKNALAHYAKIQSLNAWQFTGPFDNTSGSGFSKNYPPLYEAQPNAQFKSKTNSDIQWFVPKNPDQDAWVSIENYIRGGEGVIYAQTFVNSPDDREIVLAFGGSGDFKVWVNDMLTIEQEEELITEMDLFQRQVKLKKGANRLLVQLGHTSKTDYPNFILRLLDGQGLPAQGLSHSATYQPYARNTEADLGAFIPHFAEAFFKKKIEENPQDALNYLLLCKVYSRSQQTNKAIETLRKAEEIFPKNILIQQELLENYLDLSNRTELLRQLEYMRSLDAGLPMIILYDLEQSLDNENYDEVEKQLAALEKTLGFKNEDYYENLIRLQSSKEAYNELLETINEAYHAYPKHTRFIIFKYRVIKNTSTIPGQFLTFLKGQLENGFNTALHNALVDEYGELGNKAEIEKLLIEKINLYPQELSFLGSMANFYYRQENYKKALEYVIRQIHNAPYYSSALSDMGYVLEAVNRKEEAADYFNKAIHYDPNLFDAREKLREFQGKKSILSYFTKDDMYEVIDKSIKKETDSDSNYEYIFDERNYTVFKEGASLTYNLLAIKMLNESGVQNWKESSIGYNSLRQRLIIEKAEVIKKNGQRIAAEQSGNVMVFPSLEAGDAILIIYKLENYTGGKLGQDFWDEIVVNHFYPKEQTIYRLMTPANLDFEVSTANISSAPTITTVDDFVLREWQFKDLEKSKDESFMPSLNEAGMSIQVSSINEWRTIADWYRDVALPMGKEDYNVNLAYDEIFKDKEYATDYEKAQAIYNYLGDRIRYSSVSFRQSNYVPQKPMVTLSTQLGDCKDLSLLYHTLAKKAGLQTHLVLVNTRDNGENAMRLPSVNFNHCIIKIDLPNQTLFQELTSENLPFGSVPVSIANAQALVIPNTEMDGEGANLINIPTASQYPSQLIRKTEIRVENSDLKINTQLKALGTSSADFRYSFKGLTKERTREEVESIVSRPFTNHLELGDYSFENLEKRAPEFSYKAAFQVENELISIGGLKAIKMPFFEIICKLDNFPNEDRTYPLQYWRYEDIDYYETEILYHLPTGSSIVELPKNFSINNDFIDYSLKIEKAADQTVRVIRKVNTKSQTIPAERYKEFRETVKQIVAAEDSYVAFKVE